MRADLLSRAGLLLYRQLPEEYRYQDRLSRTDPNELGDLEAYLHGFGAFLDLARGTLEQLYSDAFAEQADNGRTIQPWLLSYLGDLVGANLLSPNPAARTAELDHSVGWYKGKGTLFTVDDIADVVSAAEAVAVEGWRRTLITPCLGLPPFSTRIEAVGDGDVLGPSSMPLGTPDLRKINRAVRDTSGGTSITTFRMPRQDANGMRTDKDVVFWKPLAREGAPCAPGHFDDTSARTPDLRDPGLADVGPSPKRIIVYVQPPEGLFEQACCASRRPERILWASRRVRRNIPSDRRRPSPRLARRTRWCRTRWSSPET